MTSKKKEITPEQKAECTALKKIFDEKKKGLGLSQASVAEQIGIKQAAVNHYLNGVNALNSAIATKFAQLLKINVEDFSPRLASEIAEMAKAISDSGFELVGKPKDGLVPVVGEATMGREDAIYLEEMKTGYVNIFSSDPEAYCLRCKGSSMEPRIHSGEYVLIEPNTPPYQGDDVLVRTIAGEYMIKTYERYEDGEYRFSSINHEHPPFNLQDDEVVYVHTVSAILKRSRFIAFEDLD